MSIEEPDAKKVITMGTLFAWLFKANQIALPLIGSAVVWTVYQIGAMAVADHGRIGSSEQEIRYIKRYFGIVQADAKEDHRAFLTTGDIATIEGRTQDTVRKWIKDRRILPTPRKDPKTGEYIFDSNYILVSRLPDELPTASE